MTSPSLISSPRALTGFFASLQNPCLCIHSRHSSSLTRTQRSIRHTILHRFLFFTCQRWEICPYLHLQGHHIPISHRTSGWFPILCHHEASHTSTQQGASPFPSSPPSPVPHLHTRYNVPTRIFLSLSPSLLGVFAFAVPLPEMLFCWFFANGLPFPFLGSSSNHLPQWCALIAPSTMDNGRGR